MNKRISYASAAVIIMAIYPAYVAAAESQPRDNSRVSARPMADDQGTLDSGKMQERMLRMHDQMHKIMNTKEGVERERLLQEHRMMIEENMRMMHGMMGGMMDCGSVSKN